MNPPEQNQPPTPRFPLLAVLETTAFLKAGPARFGRSGRDVLWSFITFVAVVPYNLFILSLLQANSEALSAIPFSVLGERYFLITTHSFVFVVLMLYGFCATQNKFDRFAPCLCALNWMALVPMVIFLPPLCLVALGVHSVADVQILAMMVSFYELWLIGFVLCHVLSIGWGTATALTCVIYIVQTIGTGIILSTG